MSDEIRLAQRSDAKGIYTVHVASEVELDDALGWGLRLGTLDYYERRLRLQSKGKHKRPMYVLTRGGIVIAMMSFGESAPGFWGKKKFADPSARALCVFDVAVAPSCQRQGIGTELMKYAEDEARNRGIRYVRLDAYAANPRSNAFYEKIGYRDTHRVAVRGTILVCYEKDLQAS